jgi:glycosyltransferase involved in cell wall biosynthesis
MIWLLQMTNAASRIAGGVAAVLDALLQRVKPEEMVILVDGGSADDTAARVADHLAFTPKWQGMAPLFYQTCFTPTPLGLGQLAEVAQMLAGLPPQRVLCQNGKLADRLAHARETQAIVALDADELIPKPAPRRIGRAALRVHLAGAHHHLSPLCAKGLANARPERLEIVQDVAQADLIVFTHPQDSAPLPDAVLRRVSGRQPPRLCLYSPEPFWDMLFLLNPAAHHAWLEFDQIGPQFASVFTHATAELYAFQQIPYGLIADPDLCARIVAGIRDRIKQTADWGQLWQGRPFRVAAMLTHRRTPAHWRKAGELRLLSGWRSSFAAACQEFGGANILGQGWTHHTRRADIVNWHRDKLAQLTHQSRTTLAIENAIAPHYVSEKLFDAFAIGAQPIMCGALDPRLQIPQEAVLSVDPDQPPDRVAAQIMAHLALPAGKAEARAFHAALKALLLRLSCADIRHAEITRMRHAMWQDMRRAAGG